MCDGNPLPPNRTGGEERDNAREDVSPSVGRSLATQGIVTRRTHLDNQTPKSAETGPLSYFVANAVRKTA